MPGNDPLHLPARRPVRPLPEPAFPGPDADDAADDPATVTRAHVEAFPVWMIETRSASTALNKHECLRQFFRFLVDEDEFSRPGAGTPPAAANLELTGPAAVPDGTWAVGATCRRRAAS